MVGRARLSDEVEEVRRIDHAIKMGNEVFRSWAVTSGGSITEISGDEGTIEIPADVLEDLPSICHTYKTAVGATVSVGLGKTLSESAKSLMAAKLRGGSRAVFYGPDVEETISARKEPTEAEKIQDEYLNKAEGSAQVSPDAIGGSPHESSEHTEAETARAVAEGAPPQQDYETSFHSAATHQETKDRARNLQNSEDMSQLKAKVAASLESLRQQLPVLNQLKSAYPDSYKAVTSLVQSVIGLSRGIQAADEQLENVQKSERPRFADIKPKKKEENEFDYSHLLPPQIQSQGYKIRVKMKSSVTGNPGDSFLSSTVISPSGSPKGRVSGYFYNGAVEPHSGLDLDLQGKGIGKALYEALYAHAKNKHGVNTVRGEGASKSAHHVHLSLAKKYGFKIKSQDPDEDVGPDVPYHYQIKSELQKTEDIGLHDVGPEEFSAAIAPSFRGHGAENLTQHPVEHYRKAKKLVISSDGHSGYAIFDDGEFGNLFSRVKGRGDALVSHASANHPGAHLNVLDSPHLVGLYSRHGAVETHREPNWTPGGPDVVHMKFGNLQKAIPKKHWVENTGGFGNPLRIPVSSNPDRKAWDQEFLRGVEDRFPGVKELRDIDIDKIVGGNSRGVANKDRFQLYSKIAGSDRLPPVVVRPLGDKYELLDGTHRTEAAKAKKLKTIPGVVMKADLEKAFDLKPIGSPEPGEHRGYKFNAHDYTHLLPQGMEGHKLKVTSYEPTDEDPGIIRASLLNHNDEEVGRVSGFKSSKGDNAIEPHSFVDEKYRGKGFGKLLYSILYSHALGEGYNRVSGDYHSESAHRVHDALARQHGFTIEGAEKRKLQVSKPYSPYSYDLGKEQLSDTEDEVGHVPVFSSTDPLDELHPVFFHHNDLVKGAMQRLYPIDPRKIKQQEIGTRWDKFNNKVLPATTEDFIGQRMSGHDSAREALAEQGNSPALEPARQRALHRLHGLTQVRKNSNGKREFLLHRGYGPDEDSIANGVKNKYSNSTSSSSWTPHLEVANKFSDWSKGGGGVSAWIPEDSIRFSMPQLGGIDNKDQVPNQTKYEHEIIVAPGEYDKHIVVRKAEDLEKASFKDIKSQNSAIKPEAPDGPRSQFFDYTHLLPQAYQKTHSLEVFHSKTAPSYMKRGRLIAVLRSKSDPGYPAHGVVVPSLKDPELGYVDVAGSYSNGDGNGVEGLVHGILGEEVPRQKTMTPHSFLKEKHHGKGVGKAMYEALYARAMAQGIDQIHGGVHSPQASAVHQSLAQKYGFKVEGGKKVPFGHDRYKYTIKDEIKDFHLEPHPDNDPVFVVKSELAPEQSVPESSDLDKIALDSAHAKKNLKLPPGTLLNGKLKVQHNDGTKGWKGVRAGLIASQESHTPLLGSNSHPVSSREPSSK
jgi:GNAT superfamily N-acetyltransferase